MPHVIEFVGPTGALRILGVTLVGVNAANGRKLLFSLIFVVLTILVGRILRWLTHLVLRKGTNERVAFWAAQAVQLATALLLLVGFTSIWFDDPTRLASFLGLVTAGLAFALQRVVTAIAGYFVLLRGKTFNVGDRIMMGGVRGDVVSLGFMQTTIMEMGQPPGEQGDAPSMWVESRQYTGRIVTVTNAKIFDMPVYNYTRDFPYIWEEMKLVISYTADRKRAEEILLEAAAQHSTKVEGLAEEALQELECRFFVKRAQLQPKVYFRLTDNWLELTVRFITEDHGIRDVKDKMSRQILEAIQSANIGIASATYDIVGFPPIRIEAASLDALTSQKTHEIARQTS